MLNDGKTEEGVLMPVKTADLDERVLVATQDALHSAGPEEGTPERS